VQEIADERGCGLAYVRGVIEKEVASGVDGDEARFGYPCRGWRRVLVRREAVVGSVNEKDGYPDVFKGE
jgi:hypothetical protein